MRWVCMVPPVGGTAAKRLFTFALWAEEPHWRDLGYGVSLWILFSVSCQPSAPIALCVWVQNWVALIKMPFLMYLYSASFSFSLLLISFMM